MVGAARDNILEYLRMEAVKVVPIESDVDLVTRDNRDEIDWKL